MTALLASRGKDFAATLGLHARTESVRLGAAALPRLKCTLWQSNPPYGLDTARELPEFHPFVGVSPPDHTANQDGLGVVFVKPYCLIPGSFPNLLVYLPRAQGVKKPRGMVMGRGKVIHPSLKRTECIRFCPSRINDAYSVINCWTNSGELIFQSSASTYAFRKTNSVR
jgi:hypothetical protein